MFPLVNTTVLYTVILTFFFCINVAYTKIYYLLLFIYLANLDSSHFQCLEYKYLQKQADYLYKTTIKLGQKNNHITQKYQKKKSFNSQCKKNLL